MAAAWRKVWRQHDDRKGRHYYTRWRKHDDRKGRHYYTRWRKHDDRKGRHYYTRMRPSLRSSEDDTFASEVSKTEVVTTLAIAMRYGSSLHDTFLTSSSYDS